jgi:lipopolysaccharide cholinephosphotransferase
MKKIENDELKELQLDMLKNVAEFCKERGIQYSLAFGTLLGAVRHKGFIPWDDDIDICMPRPSYDRFVQEYEDSEGIYECLTFEKDNKFLFPFAKVSDRRTVALEQARFVDKYSKLGVNIDIFPVDGARTDDLFQLRKQRQLHMIRYYKLRYLSMVNSSVKKVALLMVRAIISPLSMPLSF